MFQPSAHNTTVKKIEQQPTAPENVESGGERDNESGDDDEGPPPAIAPRPDHTKSVCVAVVRSVMLKCNFEFQFRRLAINLILFIFTNLFQIKMK